MTNQEIWKPAHGYEGEYEVSIFGRIRSLTRTVPCRGGVRQTVGRVLKPTIKKQTGYLQVVLHGKGVLVHRLVAMVFCEGYAANLEVNHKNGIRHDAKAENLEWITGSENQRHSYAVLGRVNPFIGKRSAEHPTSKPIVLTHIASGVAETFACGSDASRKYPQLRSDGLSRVCNGLQASHKGFKANFIAAWRAGGC